MGDLYNPFPKLPKNIRQIGDTDQVVRFYMEDYVNTYLKRLYPAGKQTMRVGLLLGNVEQYDGTPYVFVDGAIEMEDVETDGEKITFSENSWKKAYQGIEESFPKRTVQGWFLCGGPGSQLSPLNYWKQHGQYFAGKNQLMYLNHGLEGDEALYVTSEDGFYRLKGYCIYYERNQMMQDYMITRKDVRRIESGAHEQVIRDFRQRMSAKKEQAAMQKGAAGVLGVLCGVLTVAVMAGGVALFGNYNRMRQMESVLVSVLPAGVSGWDEYQKKMAEEPDFVIEELPADLLPKETGETGESYRAETMTSGEDMGLSENEGAADPENSGGQGDESGGTVPAAADGVEEAEPQTGEPRAESAGQPGSGTADSDASGDSGTVSGQPGSTMGDSGESGQPEAASGGSAGESGEPDTAAGQSVSGTGGEAGAESAGQSAAGTGTAEGNQGLVGMGKESAKAETAAPPMDYAEAAARGYRIYEVGEGETLYGICWKEYGDLSHLSQVISLNGLQNENRILVGQKLILP